MELSARVVSCLRINATAAMDSRFPECSKSHYVDNSHKGPNPWETPISALTRLSPHGLSAYLAPPFVSEPLMTDRRTR